MQSYYVTQGCLLVMSAHLSTPTADGSLGDMLYFHTYKTQGGLVCDIVEDIRRMNDQALKAAPRKTGVIILGGGKAARLAASVLQGSCGVLLPFVSGRGLDPSFA